MKNRPTIADIRAKTYDREAHFDRATANADKRSIEVAFSSEAPCERWFGIVMGESVDTSEWATERQAARIPLPAAMASALTIDLAVQTPRQG